MHIHLNSLHHAMSAIQQKIYSTFTPQQQKIILVACIAFSCLAAVYLIYRWYWATKRVEAKALEIHMGDLSVKERKLLDAILRDSPSST